MQKQGKLAKAWQTFIQMMIDLSEDHIGAYSAMAAFFLVLSIIPMLLLLLTLIQYLPISQTVLTDAIIQVFPETIAPFIAGLINEIYSASGWTIPITIVAALWAAGKALMALGRGLNCVHDTIETRNYFVVRARACLYTIFLLLAIALALLLGVFGRSLAQLIVEYLPFTQALINLILRYQIFFVILVVILVAWGIYIVLPNKKVRKIRQLPGAIFTALSWSVLVWVFSKYLQIFQGFADMYGSFTTIILLMMWFYFLMYLLLIGGEINNWMTEYNVYAKIPLVKRHHHEREQRYIEGVRKHNMERLLKQAKLHKRLDPKRPYKKPKRNEEENK